MNNNVMTSFPYLIESNATLRQLSEWKDQQLQLQLQQYDVVDPTKISNCSNHRHPTTTKLRRVSFSSTSSCVTVSTEQLSDTSLSLDDTSFDESCSLSSSSSSMRSVVLGSNNDKNNHQSNHQQQPQQQRRRRRRRSKNNNNKLVGRRVNVPNNKNNSNNSRRFSSLSTTTTPTITEEEKSNYIAMDCEMVGIGPYGATSRLARVALVSYDGAVLYDVHVQVTEVITDYRTHVSGILPPDLLPSNGAVSFTEARSTVLSLIHNKILVGHGLKSDFAALYIYNHPWYNIRDTAKYEPFMRQLKQPQHQQQQQQQPDNEYQCGVDNNNNNNIMSTPTSLVVLVPKKLKTLAYDKLGMHIQREGVAHSPIEDAIAAMELYKRHCCKWERVVQYKLDRTREIMDDY